MWLYSQAGGEISFRSCKSVKKRFSGSGEKKVVTNGKARHGTLSVALCQDAAVVGQHGSRIVRINPLLLHFYVRVENLLPVLCEFDEDDEGCVRLFYQTPAEGSAPPCHYE